MAHRMTEKPREPSPRDLPGRLLLMGTPAGATVDHRLPGVARRNQDGRAFLYYADTSLQQLLLHVGPSGKGSPLFPRSGRWRKIGGRGRDLMTSMGAGAPREGFSLPSIPSSNDHCCGFCFPASAWAHAECSPCWCGRLDRALLRSPSMLP